MQGLDRRLAKFEKEVTRLPGVKDNLRRHVFLRQLLDSVHRVRYIHVIRQRPVSPRRADPRDPIFDPIKAALYHAADGNLEEAFWCVFLFVHFGRHRIGGYRYAREVYGGRNEGYMWDWPSVAGDPEAFVRWANKNHKSVRKIAVPGGFGNHRKYESLSQLGKVVDSYVKWIAPPRTHSTLFAETIASSGGDSKRAFGKLYHSMVPIFRFGRTARFDYLAMVGKLRLAPITPGSAYLQGSTGPSRGARLLVADGHDSTATLRDLDALLVCLDRYLDVGMQAIEDSLCNWQKWPDEYHAFRG